MNGNTQKVLFMIVRGKGKLQASGFRLQASGFRLQASGFRLQASGFRLQASGFRLGAWGLGLRAYPVEHAIVGLPLKGGIRCAIPPLYLTDHDLPYRYSCIYK
jgi:hypothetical protein